jgi:hypothetical protein
MAQQADKDRKIRTEKWKCTFFVGIYSLLAECWNRETASNEPDNGSKIRTGKRDFIFLPLCSCLLSVGSGFSPPGAQTKPRSQSSAQPSNKGNNMRREKASAVTSTSYFVHQSLAAYP